MHPRIFGDPDLRVGLLGCEARVSGVRADSRVRSMTQPASHTEWFQHVGRVGS